MLENTSSKVNSLNKSFILASKSPRRQQLLAQLGYNFECISADIDESIVGGESPYQYVERLARQKAQKVTKNLSSSKKNPCIVLGSDTSVIVDDQILGKPDDLSHCIEILQQLSDRNHQVLTAIAVCCGEKTSSLVIVTEVFFKKLSKEEITRYWQSGEPQDKAGAYGIQGIGGQFVKQITGSYSAVVGLPLYETTQLLAEFGLPTSIQA